MLTRAISPPAFGKADLSNCEREQIHLAGSIQPHGAILLLREPDQIIVQASENAASFLGLQHDLIGRRLDAIEGDLAKRLRPHLTDSLHDVPRGIRCHVGHPGHAFDCLIHRPNAGGLIIELERAGASVDLSRYLEQGLQTIIAATSLRTLCDETARIFRALTGYHRVMIYRFDDQGHGEVFSEEREPDREAYLGNRYPASDIPQIARRLYERNRIRVLVDVEYPPVPLIPRLSPISGDELDMSLCFLRSSSPIHVQYLKNMGVRATLVVSLMVSGRLWGLVSAHHYVPRFVHFEERAVCELLAEAVATRISALESFSQAQAELSVRRLEQRMIRAISSEGDWRGALFDGSRALLEAVEATGAALLFEGEVRTVGDVPSTLALREIGRWLDAQPQGGVIATASLGRDAPQFELLTAIASGLLATPVSTSPGEYLIWLRSERVRTVTWGGNPFKPILVGDDAKTLSPRRSFSQWHQVVEGTADPWSDADLAAARLVGDTVSDVIIQFRSVRVLLAEDQLSQMRQQVERSHQPVIIADAAGNILKLNAAVVALLPDTATRPRSVADLLRLFANADEIAKSTAVRALAALLPPIRVVESCRYGCDPATPGAWCIDCATVLAKRKSATVPVPVVDLPLGATEDRVLGALDLERALTGTKVFEPGLLARANRGFLYIDEVNLLEDHLVDLLLDVAASGENVVEREGLSIRHPARFVLIGTGNPEEGELRPQLLDRFGLSVEVRTPTDLATRIDVIRRRDSFECDPMAFAETWKKPQDKLRRRLVDARSHLASVEVSDCALEQAARLCMALGTDGLRGDLTLIDCAAIRWMKLSPAPA